MFGFSKSKKNKDRSTSNTPSDDKNLDENSSADETPPVGEPANEKTIDAPEKKQGWFKRLKSGLKKTRGNLSKNLGTLLLGKKEINDDLFEELETALLLADVGAKATQDIMDDLSDRVARKQLANSEVLFDALKLNLLEMLAPCEQPLTIEHPAAEPATTPPMPFVILMVGVNGAGKTTTIAKLTKYYQAQGKKVMLAAGDTFRAAAIEQLQAWGERNNVPVISQPSGSDSASVIFDALQSAKAREFDILIADTAGRLHTQSHLMDELKKIKRVMAKLDHSAPHETMLVLDASMGQNALSQADQFNQAVGVSGIALTKLDGTAKGGIIFALAKQLGTPLRFIGVGEQADDLKPFNAKTFIDALFEE